MKKIKVFENFRSLQEFKGIKRKRRCWSECHNCKTKWDLIQTESVHMINMQSPKDFVNRNGTFFICDNCLNQYKNEAKRTF